MIRYYNFDIVFAEIPDEVTLAINITGCPYRCEGCHSPHLREDRGERLDADALAALLERYGVKATIFIITGKIGAPRYLTAEQLRDWARMMEIEFVHITKDTTVESLEHELFLNDLAWKLK